MIKPMENSGWQKVILWGGFIFFLGSLLLRQESAITQDLGRHLRLGEMIVKDEEQRKCALYSNCLTYTYPNYPFINHHWGSEVIFYSVYKLGGLGGLILFKAIILGTAFLITAIHATPSLRGSVSDRGNPGDRHAPLRQGFAGLAMTAVPTVITFTIIFFSIQMMADRLTIRPEIFGYLLFSLLFWLLNSSFPKRHFSLFLVSCSLLIALWVNLHISFIFGLILVWLWAGSFLIKKGVSFAYAKETPYQKTILAIPVISTLVTFFNPSGLRGALMPLSIMKDYGYTIVENMTPFFLRAFKPQPEYWIYTVFLVMTLGLLFFSSAKKNVFNLLTFLTFSLFPIIAVRHLPFFALAVVPILTPLLFNLFKVFKGYSFASAKEYPSQIYQNLPILVAGGLFLAAITNPVPFAFAKLPPTNLAADPRHDKAIEFVKKNRFQGRMWNNYDIGSFLEWSLPEYPTFVDGRPEAFPVGFFQKTYIPMQQNQELWDQKVGEYNIQWALAAITDATPWFQKWWQLIQQNKNWKIIYLDGATAVLVRLDGLNKNIEPIGKAKTLELLTIDKSRVVK